jgi:glucosamine-6-phosphate deaminase
VRPRLDVVDDDRWTEHVTQRWAAYHRERTTARLCLPTGNTPRPLYARSAPLIDFTQTTVFLLDEFGLPPADPARCDAMFERDFLANLDRPPEQVHRLNVQAADLEVECRRFEALVDDGGLDLTLLGLGDNGHIGLNEPGTNADSPTRVVRLASSTREAARRYGSQAEPEWGLTLGMRPILDSREIWLLVTGPGKAGILNVMLNGPIGSEVPASLLRNHPNVIVFADRSAAGQSTEH